MKKVVVVVCFFCLIALSGLIGCSDAQSGGKNRLSKLDNDAVDMAKMFYFSKRIIKCGDFTYTSEADVGMGAGQFIRVKHTGTIHVRSEPLSEADKMNGYEWRGIVDYIAKGPSQSRWGQPSYGEWSDRGLSKSIGLIKRNSGWAPNENLDGLKQISCEEVER